MGLSAGNDKKPIILIAGGGIAGLTAALCLAKSGNAHVRVFEQAPAPAEVGAGIQVSPNASRILIALGLGAALDHVAVMPDELRIFNGRRGRLLTSLPLAATARSRYGAPYYVVHRADLQVQLLEAVKRTRNASVHFDCNVDALAAHGRGITIQTSAGQEHTGQALIGADGLRSAVRRHLVGDGEPVYSGYTAWRGMVPAEKVPDQLHGAFTGLWLNRSAHVVHYPVQGGHQMNVVVIVRGDTPYEGWAVRGHKDDLLPALAHLSGPFRDLLQRVDHWLTWSLFDRQPERRIVADRAALIGDAAHPMLPFLAQGGAMAIEDAEAIAKALESNGYSDIPQAFRTYQAAREKRTAKVQKAARRNGKIYHASGLTAVARNLTLRLVPPARLLSRFDWLYDYGHNPEA